LAGPAGETKEEDTALPTGILRPEYPRFSIEKVGTVPEAT
jgi:hypothetical protein